MFTVFPGRAVVVWFQARHFASPATFQRRRDHSVATQRHIRPGESNGVSNGLSGELKLRIFQEVIEEDDEFPHDGGESFFISAGFGWRRA
jgi:hypothetical protein